MQILIATTRHGSGDRVCFFQTPDARGVDGGPPVMPEAANALDA